MFYIFLPNEVSLGFASVTMRKGLSKQQRNKPGFFSLLLLLHDDEVDIIIFFFEKIIANNK